MRKNLQELFDEFMYECEFLKKTRPQTIKGYREVFSLFIKIQPSTTLELLTTSTVTYFFKTLEERKRVVGKRIVKKGIKKSTVATYWSKLNPFFEWLRIKGHIQNNPFKQLPYPTPCYEDRKFLRKEEIEKILTAILTKSDSNFILKRNLALFYILLFCGIRREELISLQVRDIDFDRKILNVRAETSKVKRNRSIPMHSLLLQSLKDYLKARIKNTSPLLLVSSTQDKGLSMGGLKHLVQTLRDSSGVNFHLHQLRHTFAVNFLKASNNIAKLKQLLGHKNINMTIYYLRCLPISEFRGDVESMLIDDFI